jgi:hypothetical protein
MKLILETDKASVHADKFSVHLVEVFNLVGDRIQDGGGCSMLFAVLHFARPCLSLFFSSRTKTNLPPPFFGGGELKKVGGFLLPTPKKKGVREVSMHSRRRRSIVPRLNEGAELPVFFNKSSGEAICMCSPHRFWSSNGGFVSEVPPGFVPTSLPLFPDQYGSWESKLIGGVSSTVRRVGCITSSHPSSCIIVFSLNTPSEVSLASSLSQFGDSVTVGDAERNDEYGVVVEVIVHSSGDVSKVCACIAREGGIPLLENDDMNDKRAIGVERLDRVDDGFKRGISNWKFCWAPEIWKKPPITWDFLVDNCLDDDNLDVFRLSLPLKQHVAERLVHDNNLKIGCRWVQVDRSRASEHKGWPLLRDAHRELCSFLESGRMFFSSKMLEKWGCKFATFNVLLETDTGKIFRPRDVQSMLKNVLSTQRCHVSCALSLQQSKQVVSAFYTLCIESASNTEVRSACASVLIGYMMERGYTARWMGKYVQNASFIGNGDTFRRFKRLVQYDPERLPSSVLNKILDANGVLKLKGSKGSRSKYKRKGKYVPVKKVKRKFEDEDVMRLCREV